MIVYIIFGALLSASRGKPAVYKRYDGFKVYQVEPTSSEAARNVMNLSTELCLDIWRKPRTFNETFDIQVPPDVETKFLNSVENLGLDAKVWISDLQRLIDDERKTIHRTKRDASDFKLDEYHTASEINSYLDYVASISPLARVLSMGRSYEGRNMKYIKISGGSAQKAIYIDGGMHAREWISVSTMLYLIHQLAVNPTNDSAVDRLLEKFDFYILPLVNPDGYEYSWTHDRFWRKNRHPTKFLSAQELPPDCIGVDLNRNFGYHWNPNNGGSPYPCSEQFSGNEAMSEPEVTSIARFMTSGLNILAYLNFHSYGQYWIYPWGFTPAYPPDVRDLDHVARIASTAIYKKHEARFTVGQGTIVLCTYIFYHCSHDPASGGADDYAKGEAGIKYAYTVELRDTGRYGFVLPRNYIIPVGEETWEGVKAFASEIMIKEHL